MVVPPLRVKPLIDWAHYYCFTSLMCPTICPIQGPTILVQSPLMWNVKHTFDAQWRVDIESPFVLLWALSID